MGDEIPEWLGQGEHDDDPPPVTWACVGQHLEPVMIEHVQVCAWKQKPCGTCGKPKSNKVHRSPEKGGTCAFQRRLGCERCGKAKADADHLGAPESFNLFASGSWEAYQGAKKRWHAVLAPLLRRAGLPKGLGSVFAEATCVFPTQGRRDKGNHRVVLEKALGDVLVEEGYIVDDSWDFYDFGNVDREHKPGVSGVRVVLFPRAPTAEQDALSGQTSLLDAGGRP